ncbi:MAG TPA: hypothetical protein PJ982_10050 [Lacipirellulaceae bacterium]|nr:hypothetical protein [Lacipirellulaceae bacterium]
MRIWMMMGAAAGLLCGLTLEPRPLQAASSADQQMVALVAARIFAEAEPVPGWVWPPLVAISDKEEVNAFATIYHVKPGKTPEVKDEGRLTWIEIADVAGLGRLGAADAELDAADGADEPPAEHEVETRSDGTVTQPIIVLYQGFLDKIVQGKPDRLAAVFGHEAAHILLRHVDNALPGAPLVANMITRQQEAAADILGMKLGLAAGFPYKGLVAGILAMRDNSNYNSFEGLNASHPGWTDRVAMIDEQQSALWKSISAFENGVYFLLTEQYRLAEQCFDQVTKDCPKCYEAWANLGYARLMLYCDKLDVDDLRNLDVGQLVVGGFYRRPSSLEDRSRGMDEKLWFEAVGALRQAIILNPDLVLAKANLAVAYLLSPQGKDVGQAERLFREVNAALAAGTAEEMDPMVLASLLVNAGVTEGELGNAEAAEALFAQAEELFKSGGTDAVSASIQGAIRYNRGRMFAAASEPARRRTALGELEAYLTGASSAANWWPLAYEQYRRLCTDQGVEPKTQEELARTANRLHRLVTGVTLEDGTLLTLNEAIDQTLSALEESLGKGVSRDVVKNSNIRRLSYTKLGIELLYANELVAIRLQGSHAPPVMLQAAGPGGAVSEIRTGMTLAELEKILGGDASQWDQRFGTNAQIVYRFYTRLGFGVRIAGDKVSEIIVAQIPVEAKL